VRGADLRAATDVSGALAVTPTPDDGVRRSDVLVFDESTRPEGLPVDPERGYTSNERASGKYHVDIHDGLRAELAEIYRLIEQVAAGSMDAGSARAHLNPMTMRRNNWALGTYCEAYCRGVTTHHTLEDRGVFPHLLRGDPRLAPVLDRLQQEHVAITT